MKFSTHYDRLPKKPMYSEEQLKQPSATKQSFTEQCDINRIMKNVANNGAQLPPPGQSIYGDISNVDDFRTMVDKVQRAHDSFAALPAIVRARFDNDPAQLLAFLQDASNKDEAIYLGLLPKPAQEAAATETKAEAATPS